MTQNHELDVTVKSLSEYRYAGFWMRFWAYIIDFIVIGSLNRILINPILIALEIPTTDPFIFSWNVILTTIVFYAYFILLTKYFGQTLGKMILGIRVIEENKSSLSWLTIIFRELVGRFISTVFFLAYIVSAFTTAFTERKKALHDIFADTYVVHTKK